MKHEIEAYTMVYGEQQPPKRKGLIDRENRITTIINYRENCSVMEFLGIAHNLSL